MYRVYNIQDFLRGNFPGWFGIGGFLWPDSGAKSGIVGILQLDSGKLRCDFKLGPGVVRIRVFFLGLLFHHTIRGSP